MIFGKKCFLAKKNIISKKNPLENMFYQAMIPCKIVLLLMFAIASLVKSSNRGNDDWQQTISNSGSSSSGQQPTRIMDESRGKCALFMENSFKGSS
jgi:hypothetical protein